MSDTPRFDELELDENILRALTELGYETPSPIQARCIPILLNGQDVLGMAQTGTGKTAAFALPLLQRIDLKASHPQVLVLCPTRELAVQVAEAFQAYARFMRGFHVLPIYGGQSYSLQLRQLKRGPQVVVGTPGRVMDHLERGTLKLDKLNALVLDEADEMLRMGFIEAVETIMAKTPETRQTALFSATMPEEIRRITSDYMCDPQQVKIAAKTSTVSNIEQRCWMIQGVNKLDALTRMLEAEDYDGVIIFARTKNATAELAEKLEARGYSAAALNGDMNQTLRERTVDRLKKGNLDILVATDVAARGLDVDRISLVVNYDIPYDTEAYVHRIGRTGRAGRQGKAILFVSYREKRLLRAIEKATSQPIEPMELPSRDLVTQKRVDKFRDQLVDVFASEDLSYYRELLGQLSEQLVMEPSELASALLYLAQKEKPLQLPPEAPVRERKPRKERDGDRGHDKRDRPDRDGKKRKFEKDESIDWERYRIDVGRDDGVEPKHIVGTIANEADLNSRYIGHVKLHDDYSTVELPEGMPKELLQHFQKLKICGKPMHLQRIGYNDDRQGKTDAESDSRGPRKRQFNADNKRKPRVKPHRKGPGGGGKKPKRSDDNG
ncbi:DEAD/DEAH box helicase [Motiliproteus sp.]|uniref:DEAD/DEAH box helicase n=1 Tax=Motiliproteus sp. TaxID=1898955 RepID=UPI003BAAD872